MEHNYMYFLINEKYLNLNIMNIVNCLLLPIAYRLAAIQWYNGTVVQFIGISGIIRKLQEVE